MFSRLLAGNYAVVGCGDDPLESQWLRFVSTPEFERLSDSVYDNDSEHLLCRDSWSTALAEGCTLWKALVHDKVSPEEREEEEEVPSSADLEEAEIWDTVCFLIKGSFYVANGLPVCRLAQETNSQYILHAAVGALSRCAQEEGANLDALSAVFECVLELHFDQLSQSGPIIDRLPLHIAASNKGPLLQHSTLNPPSKIDIRPKEFNVKVLEKILELSPTFAVSTPDAIGQYPLHLACANGFTWVSGLELLFRSGPEIGVEACSISSLLVRMAGVTATNETLNKSKSKNHKIGRWLRKRVLKKKKQLRYYKTMTGNNTTPGPNKDIEAVETIYRLLAADPNTVLGMLNF
jgi:hypothetical protein